MNWRNKIAVANKGEDSISILDTDVKKEECRIRLGPEAGPHVLAKMKDTSNLLVIQVGDNSLACLDLDKGAMEKILFVGCSPSFMAVCDKTHSIYVVNADSDSVSIIHNSDDLKLVGQIPTGSMPQGIDCHPSLPLLAIANMNSQDIWLVETESYSTIKRMVIDGYPIQVKFSLKGDRLYIGCYYHNHRLTGKILLMNIDGYSISDEIITGCMPCQFSETNDGRFLLVVSSEARRLEVIDLVFGGVVNSVKVGDMAWGITLDSEERYVYVTNPKEGTVSVIDWRKGKKIGSIPVGKEPTGIVYLA